MTDAIDRANDIALFTNKLAIKQHLADTALPAQQVADGVVECMDCDVDIPVARLAVLPNCVRCVDCQTMHEIRDKQ